MDRVPLSHVQEVSKSVEMESVPGNQPVDKTIEEMRAMRTLSLMFGFDGDNFDGNLGKVLNIWDWAKSDGLEDIDALLRIKDAIRSTGGTGSELVNKVYIWASIQGDIDSLKKKQSVLENEH